ncbi:MAG TPA: acyl-CoA dehydrogenase C-terminal domain-containing protein, partial [Pararhizobium sp.]|nr:acyl-CoA dehydrogenase C-terminal domain-containing protein [Pararhizobium sp.]
CEAHRNDETMDFFTKHLKKGLNDLQASTMWFMRNAMAKPDNAGAGSTDYLHLFGLVAIGYLWAQMALAAKEKLAEGDGDEPFLKGKLVTARFYMERLMPETALRRTRIEAGAETMMALAAEAF